MDQLEKGDKTDDDDDDDDAYRLISALFYLNYYYKRTISKYDIPSINIIYHQIY